MRLAIVSDAHCRHERIFELIEALPPIDALCFLGDIAADGALLRQSLGKAQPNAICHAVAGNLDTHCDDPAEILLPIAGSRILLTHGHRYRVKMGTDLLAYRAQETDSRAALYGHTHFQKQEYANGILLLNPGALCNGQYALLDVRLDGLYPKLLQL